MTNPPMRSVDCFETRSRTTAKEEVGARWRKLALERGKQRLTDSTLETGGWGGGRRH